MLNVTIKKDKWCRGLISYKGKSCALGHVALELGIEPMQLVTTNDERGALVGLGLMRDVGGYYSWTYVASRLASINDESMGGWEMVTKLNALCEREGLEIRFSWDDGTKVAREMVEERELVLV